MGAKQTILWLGFVAVVGGLASLLAQLGDDTRAPAPLVDRGRDPSGWEDVHRGFSDAARPE